MEWKKLVDRWPANNAIGYEQVNGMEWNKEWTADLPTMQWGTNKKVNAME